VSASELYRPSDRRLSTKLVSTFADRRCHIVSVTNPYGCNLDFLDRSRYFLFQVALQLYSRGWVDAVQDRLLLRKFGSVGNRTRASGSVGRSSDHYTTEAIALKQECGTKSNTTVTSVAILTLKSRYCVHLYKSSYITKTNRIYLHDYPRSVSTGDIFVFYYIHGDL
jgi:hypothetical protein